MAIDTKFAELATRLIGKRGRDVTIAKSGNVVVDALKPWRNRTGPATEPSPGTSITGKGVFINQADQDNFGFIEEDLGGTQLKRGQQRVLVDQGALSVDTEIDQFDILIDSRDGRMWRIMAANVLEPGTTRILYDFTVEQ